MWVIWPVVKAQCLEGWLLKFPKKKIIVDHEMSNSQISSVSANNTKGMLPEKRPVEKTLG